MQSSIFDLTYISSSIDFVEFLSPIFSEKNWVHSICASVVPSHSDNTYLVCATPPAGFNQYFLNFAGIFFIHGLKMFM